MTMSPEDRDRIIKMSGDIGEIKGIANANKHLLTALNNTVAANHEGMDTRVRKLEAFRAKAQGMAAVLVLSVGAVVAWAKGLVGGN